MGRGFESIQAVLAANLRKARESKGLSQELLALEAEVDRTYVSQIERGVCNPSLRVLDQIASTLKVPVVDLLRVPERGK
jgi:transcriptional regulator with XRE-family HTH domain